MRKREKNFLITTERHELVIVRGGQLGRDRGFCSLCGYEVEFVSFDVAVSISGSSGRDLARRIESGDVHSVDSGSFRVCRSSLEKEI